MPDAGRAVMGFQDFTVKVTLRAFVTVLVFSIVLMVLGLPFIAACTPPLYDPYSRDYAFVAGSCRRHSGSPSRPGIVPSQNKVQSIPTPLFCNYSGTNHRTSAFLLAMALK